MNWDHIKNEINDLSETLIQIRHDLHRHPELGFEERRTQGVVRDWLERHGYEPRECAGTGLIADLNPGAGGTTIALRADMDALPIQEDIELAYRSVKPGVAHKCGHDGHTTVLMGAAAILSKHRGDLAGNVRLLFQPAEEGVRGGGAIVMVGEGALDGVDEAYGLHSWAGWAHRELRIAEGPMMAQVHSFTIEVRGKGGHGSQPQLCRDPIIAASHLVTSLQTVVSRGLGYEGGAVLSVCSFNAGTANNIIPDRAELSGTIRTFSEATSERVLERLHEVARGAASTFGVEVEVEVEVGYPVLLNDPRCVEVVRRVAAEVDAIDRVSSEDLPMAGGEDFAYFAQTCPSAFFFLSTMGDDGDPPGCHHPDFDFDDTLIPTGVEIFLRIVADRLRRTSG
jgi:amidohydrolase